MGLGSQGRTGVAQAVVNTIFVASGKRVRRPPINAAQLRPS
jgi:CO/xanthine dehydrogenase Mo-binding subunit